MKVETMSKTNTARKPRSPKAAKPVMTPEIEASILAAMNAVAPAEPKAKRAKQPIPNISKLSTPQLLDALAFHGVDPEPEGVAMTRPEAIQAAKDNGLWDYSGDVVPAAYKAKYGAAQNCGDNVAKLLVRPDGMDQGHHLAFLADVADANEINFGRWDHCNYGQKVMNLGNVLRGKIKRGEYVIVGNTEWNVDAVD